MMIRKYNMLSIPFFAFFSRRAYRDVGKNWRGVNFAYLFLLLAICCLPPTLALREQMIQSINNNQLHLINQIPDLQIKNGHVDFEQNIPYVITRKDGSPAVIIDTTGSMNFIDDPRVYALLLESSLIVRSGESSFNTIDLSGVSDFHINQAIAGQWLQTVKDTMAPISYGVFLLLSYVFGIVSMILAAIVALILSTAMHSTISFASAIRIATIAATPSIIFITISAAMGIAISPAIHLAVTLLYLLVGVRSCAKPLSAREAEHVDLKAFLNEEELSDNIRTAA